MKHVLYSFYMEANQQNHVQLKKKNDNLENRPALNLNDSTEVHSAAQPWYFGSSAKNDISDIGQSSKNKLFISTLPCL